MHPGGPLKYDHPVVVMSISLDPLVRNEFRDLCADRDLKMSAVINQLIVEWLAKNQ